MMLSRLFPTALAIAAFSASAYAQTNLNTAESQRIERLERDLQLIQRQISRGDVGEDGADAPQGAQSGSNAALEVRLSQMDEEMRRLRGKFEESEFRTKQLGERLDKMQKDVDFRFNEMSAAKAAAAADLTPPAAAPAPEAAKAAAKPEAKPETKAETKTESKTEAKTPLSAKAEESPDTEALNRMVEEVANEQSVPKENHDEAAADTTDKPVEKTSAGDGQLKPPAETTQGPRELYNHAFKLLNQTKYDDAAGEFTDFTQKYPKDPLVGNAFYWLGETHYIKRDYVKAADTFRQGFEALPTGPKAADNLLKLSMSLSAMQKTKEACVVLDQILVKFSKTSTSVTQKAQQERARVGCK